MEYWKNTKCGTCIVQRQKPICNSCRGHQFYKPKTNFDMCCESIENMAQIIDIAKIGWTKEQIIEWLQSEVKGSDV